MECYIVTFKYEGQLANGPQPDYTDGVAIKEIIALLRAGGVAMIGWEKSHHFEMDHHDEFTEAILENHTLIEVRLDVDETLEGDEAIDWHDGGDDLFHYVVDALELGEPEITYFYTGGDVPMQKTIIGIDVHPAS